MLDLDEAAVTRAAGLLRAFRADDRATFDGIMASDYQRDPPTPWVTFCAVFAFADRGLDWLEHETGHDHETLLAMFTQAMVDFLTEWRNGNDGDTGDTGPHHGSG